MKFVRILSILLLITSISFFCDKTEPEESVEAAVTFKGTFIEVLQEATKWYKQQPFHKTYSNLTMLDLTFTSCFIETAFKFAFFKSLTLSPQALIPEELSVLCNLFNLNKI